MTKCLLLLNGATDEKILRNMLEYSAFFGYYPKVGLNVIFNHVCVNN